MHWLRILQAGSKSHGDSSRIRKSCSGKYARISQSWLVQLYHTKYSKPSHRWESVPQMFILRLSQFSPTFLSPSHEEGNLVLCQTHGTGIRCTFQVSLAAAESISHKKEFRDWNNKCLGVARSSAMKWNLHEARPMQIVHGRLPREISSYARMDIHQLLSERKNE
jgi:hypothetical protein